MAGIDPRTRATAKQFGVVKLANAGETGEGFALGVNDPRVKALLTVPKHVPTHKRGGSDALKLDELADPTDNTNGDATTARHGLFSKLDKIKLDSLATGTFSVVATAPTSGQGANNDCRLVIADGGFYYKSAGSWTLLGKIGKVTDADVTFVTPTAGNGVAQLTTS